MSTAYNLVNRFVKIPVLGNGERKWDALADLLIQASFLAVSYSMDKYAVRFKYSDQSELVVDNHHQHGGSAMATVYEDDEYVISYR